MTCPGPHLRSRNRAKDCKLYSKLRKQSCRGHLGHSCTYTFPIVQATQLRAIPADMSCKPIQVKVSDLTRKCQSCLLRMWSMWRATHDHVNVSATVSLFLVANKTGITHETFRISGGNTSNAFILGGWGRRYYAHNKVLMRSQEQNLNKTRNNKD